MVILQRLVCNTVRLYPCISNSSLTPIDQFVSWAIQLTHYSSLVNLSVDPLSSLSIIDKFVSWSTWLTHYPSFFSWTHFFPSICQFDHLANTICQLIRPAYSLLKECGYCISIQMFPLLLDIVGCIKRQRCLTTSLTETSAKVGEAYWCTGRFIRVTTQILRQLSKWIKYRVKRVWDQRRLSDPDIGSVKMIWKRQRTLWSHR